MTKAFCTELTDACATDIDFPTYGSLSYCEKHTGTQTDDLFWSYPYTQGKGLLCSRLGSSENGSGEKRRIVQVQARPPWKVNVWSASGLAYTLHSGTRLEQHTYGSMPYLPPVLPSFCVCRSCRGEIERRRVR